MTVSTCRLLATGAPSAAMSAAKHASTHALDHPEAPNLVYLAFS